MQSDLKKKKITKENYVESKQFLVCCQKQNGKTNAKYYQNKNGVCFCSKANSKELFE